MCGIVGCILKDNEEAAPVLLECISKLEYRGYDSVGIATISDRLNVKKGKGAIAEVNEELHLADMPGHYGIAHTRWATHGEPSKENAHPQIDCTGDIAVVHNGIIRNYVKIRKELEGEGHIFKSQTDTEVIPHLLEKYMGEGLDLEKALRKTIGILDGTYAIAAICVNEPNKIIATRKDSPLIVGIGDEQYFIASDAPAILDYTRTIFRPEEGEIVILEESGVTVRNENDEIIEKELSTIDWTPDMAEKGGYEYFMLKEINEQAKYIQNTLTQKENIEKIIGELDDVERICFVACGTSYHASLTGKYLIESLVSIPVDVILASEFKYSINALDEKTLCIFISQSGETADTLDALKMAREKSKTLGIVNIVGSAIASEADFVIYTHAGPEIGVAATKTYLCQLTAIYLFAAMLSLNMAPDNDSIDLAQTTDLLRQLDRVPEFIEEVLAQSDSILKMARKYRDKHDFFFIGRGYSYPIALEGALKLKEITYIHGEGYAAGELKHGPLALMDEGVPVVVIMPPGEDYDHTMSNLEEVKARKAEVIAVTTSDERDLGEKADDIIAINPDVSEIIAPLVYIVPLQIFAYYVAIEKECDPDKPRNLAKSVTVN